MCQEVSLHIFRCWQKVQDKNIKKLMKKRLKTIQNEEQHAIKILDMMGFCIRCISHDDESIHSLLSRLGVHHRNMGIKINHFLPLLFCFHQSFQLFFNELYTPEVA